MIIKVCGTVSPYCHQTKNCPGFLIEDRKTKVLLDCGNGITRELDMEKDLQNLTIIISHLHKDHYGDLLSIAYASYIYHNLGILDKRIKVYIPDPNKNQELLTSLDDYNYLTNLGEENYLEFATFDENTHLKIDNFNISFTKNPHQVSTYATKVTKGPTSIVYTSDTGYQHNTIEEFAKNTDLLICESTFLKGQLKKLDFHLYAYEAAQIATKASPKKLLLTHFWPEIDKKLYLEEAKQIFPNTEVAEEGKVLKLERR